jgi:ATP-dependent DNA helicase RecG
VLTDDEILGLLGDTESDRVERTVSTTDTAKFCEAICAFSNDFPNHRQPGFLMVGAHDDGSLAGLDVTDELLLYLGGLRSDGNIQPIPSMAVEKRSFPGGDLAVVTVFPSELPPVRYKGRVWIRVGPRRAIASEADEKILSERRTAFQRTFDVRPCQGSGLHDLSLDLFLVTYRTNAIAEDILRENRRDLKVQMASLRFYDLTADCPTNAGVLLFGKDPLNWLPGAYVQFVRYDGTKLSDSVQNERTSCANSTRLYRPSSSLARPTVLRCESAIRMTTRWLRSRNC